MSKENDLYVAETQVWLDQQSVRIADSLQVISSLKKEISLHKELIALEQKQIRLIKQRRADAQNSLKKYLNK